MALYKRHTPAGKSAETHDMALVMSSCLAARACALLTITISQLRRMNIRQVKIFASLLVIGYYFYTQNKEKLNHQPSPRVFVRAYRGLSARL